jgi:hypothetical protein
MLEEFTEAQYRLLLCLAKERFNIIPFTEYKNYNGSLLLRHDMDFSVHRAAKMAKIEHDLGISSTYFIHPHSKFYNILEDDTVNKIWEIADLGHNFGLHFDPSFYDATNKPPAPLQEKQLVEDFLDIGLDAISTHMPSLVLPDHENSFDINASYIHELVNTNSDFIRRHYNYCSDSFSRWRFKSFDEMLVDKDVVSLHALIHPEWWTEKPTALVDKIYRCILGRDRCCSKYIEKIYKEWCDKNNAGN